MQSTTEATKDVGIGSILQVSPDGDLPPGLAPETNPIDKRHLQLGIVREKHAWGVRIVLADNTVIPLAWEHVEPTGGRIIWGPDGKRVAPLPPGIKHHE